MPRRLWLLSMGLKLLDAHWLWTGLSISKFGKVKTRPLKSMRLREAKRNQREVHK